MCVVAIAWRASEKWPLIMIGNRDEYHARPAAPLSLWEDGSGIIAGRDLQSGGTWLGVTQQGRLAVITNVRNPDGPSTGLQTRGELITGALMQGIGYLNCIDGTRYNPFNLLVADGDRMEFASNAPNAHALALKPGIYAVSNGAFDEPWPKVGFLKQGLAEWTSKVGSVHDDLFGLLADENASGLYGGTLPEDLALIEAQNTPAFIRSPIYGTRCSTVVTVGADGNGIIAERRFNAQGTLTGEGSVPFTW